MTPVATGLACLHLDTPRLDESTAFYVDAFGLSVGERRGDAAALVASDGQRAVVLRRAERAGLAALEFSADDLGDLAEPTDAPFSGGARALRDPDGGLVLISARPAVQPAIAGDRPERVSHAVINSPDPARLVRFYEQRLGFRVSDRYERELLTFLRARSPQHHCLGVAPAERAGLNHFAVETGTIDALMTSVGRMRQAGHEPIWGPGRHGPGGNVFCYYADPAGLVAEFTCEVMQVGDDWRPTTWERTPANGNVWGTGAPSSEAVRLMHDGPPAV